MSKVGWVACDDAFSALASGKGRVKRVVDTATHHAAPPCFRDCLLVIHQFQGFHRQNGFEGESPCSSNTTSDENGGWIFDLLRLASRAGRTALLSESGGTPLLLSAPALLPLSLAPCRLSLFSDECSGCFSSKAPTRMTVSRKVTARSAEWLRQLRPMA